MIYILLEISNYPQLVKLQQKLIGELDDQLQTFASNRGGRLVRKLSGFFLYSFHPERERAMILVSDFLFLSHEVLTKREGDLFGFTLLLEDWGDTDPETVFNHMKSMIFLTPRQNRIWCGPQVLEHPDFAFVRDGEDDGLTEISGPIPQAPDTQQRQRQLLGATGWVEALSRNLNTLMDDSRGGRILRITTQEPVDKWPFLEEALRQAPGPLPVLYPSQASRDPWVQLGHLMTAQQLDQVEGLLGPERQKVWKDHPQWKALGLSRGLGPYPGDMVAQDFQGLLSSAFSALGQDLQNRGLPRVFVLLLPEAFQEPAQKILESVLMPLLKDREISLAILTEEGADTSFLATWPGASWTLPSLNPSRIEREIPRMGPWNPLPLDMLLRASGGRGMGVVHSQALSHPWQEGDDPSWALLCELETTHRKIYYMALLGSAVLTVQGLVEFFLQLGEDGGVIGDKLERLVQLGFVCIEPRMGVLRPDFRQSLEALFPQEATFLRQRLAAYLAEKYFQSRDMTAEPVWKLLMASGQWDLGLRVLRIHASQKIGRGQGDLLPQIREKELLGDWPLPEDWKYRFLLHGAAFRLRFALAHGLRRWEPSHLKLFRRKFPSHGPEAECSEWLLQSGRFLFQTGDQDTGFLQMKNAFIQSQKQGDTELELRSSTEIGFALLYKRRIEEAREYFEMASRSASRAQLPFIQVFSGMGHAISLFLWGNFSGTLDLARELESLTAPLGMHRAWIFSVFLRGRVQFVLGDYSSAVDSFVVAQARAREYGLSEALTMLSLWEARALNYWGEGQKALEKLAALGQNTLEARFFTAEAHFFQKDLQKAFETIQDSLTMTVQEPIPGEIFRWTSGFAMIEDRVHPLEGAPHLLELVTLGFRAFLRGKLGQPNEAVEELHPWTTRKGLFDGNPHSHLFHYWQYSLMSKDDRSLEAQRITILGRGLKDLQTRASRIGDHNRRNDYLQIPYWNRLYMEEARKNKLV